MTTLHRDEVDGVPTFWVDTGRPTLYGALVFRSGIADETLSTTGWLHLVEHLALHDRDHGTLRVDGSVSLLTTRLVARGEPADVVEALAAVCRWLADPDLWRVADESRVLRAESEFRGTGDAATAMLQRFGARGPGLAGYTEPGLTRASVDGIRDLTRRVFARGNAALVLDGPPPAGMTLPLPGGPHLALPEAPRAEDSRPAAYATGGGLVLSGEVPRTYPATFLPVVLEDLLRRDLREGAGGAYAPWASYEGVDDDTAVVLAGSDVAESLLPTVAHLVTTSLATLRAQGPRPDVVENAVAGVLQQMRDPYAAVSFADSAATAHLLGRAVEEPEELIAQVGAVTRDDVAALVPAFGDSLLLGIPGRATWDDELPMLRMPVHAAAPGGARYRSRNRPAERDVLVVDDSAVHMGRGQTWQRVELSSLAGVLAMPDGGRHLVGPDGWGLAVEPTMWHRGTEAVARLDALVSADRQIPMPGRDPSRVPQPLDWWPRWKALLARVPVWVYLLVAAFVLLLVGIYVWRGVFGALFVGMLVGAWTQRKESRRASP